jgi:Ca2+-binding EF-hand superfamily protein
MMTRKAAVAASIALFLGAIALPASANDAMDYDKFVKMCDTNKDGMVSKEEFMKHVDKMWTKMDAKKVGKMETKQFELFLKELMKSGA